MMQCTNEEMLDAICREFLKVMNGRTEEIKPLQDALEVARRERDQLRLDFDAEIRERKAAVCERDEAIRERDEARREVCELENLDWIGSVCRKGEKETAQSRGWECFKEETK